MEEGRNCPPYLRGELGIGSSPALGWNLQLGSQACGLRLDDALTLLGLQLVDGRSWDLSASMITWANSF